MLAIKVTDHAMIDCPGNRCDANDVLMTYCVYTLYVDYCTWPREAFDVEFAFVVRIKRLDEG